MFRSFTAAGLVALSLSSAAFAETAIQVKSVVVEADLATVENRTAAGYWADLSTDLTNAIVARVADRIDEKGVAISVDIAEVELSNGFQEALGLADTRLTGKVRVRNAEDPSRDKTYDLTIDVNQAKAFIPAGTDVTTLPAGTRIYYDAMVGAFADAVVRDLG